MIVVGWSTNKPHSNVANAWWFCCSPLGDSEGGPGTLSSAFQNTSGVNGYLDTLSHPKAS